MKIIQTIQMNTPRVTLDQLRDFVEATAHLDGTAGVGVRCVDSQSDPLVSLTVTL